MKEWFAPWFGLVARLVVGVVWIVAGALKLPDPAESVRAVRAYELLPEAVVPAVGTLLPIVEVALGACLVLGVLIRGAGLLSSLLLLAFIAGIVSAWARGLQIDCGCFGGGGEVDDASYAVDLARDAGLLLLSAWLVVRPGTRWSLDSLIFRPLPSSDDPSTETQEEDPDGPEEAEEERRPEAGGPGPARGPARPQ